MKCFFLQLNAGWVANNGFVMTKAESWSLLQTTSHSGLSTAILETWSGQLTNHFLTWLMCHLCLKVELGWSGTQHVLGCLSLSASIHCSAGRKQITSSAFISPGHNNCQI